MSSWPLWGFCERLLLEGPPFGERKDRSLPHFVSEESLWIDEARHKLLNLQKVNHWNNSQLFLFVTILKLSGLTTTFTTIRLTTTNIRESWRICVLVVALAPYNLSIGGGGRSLSRGGGGSPGGGVGHIGRPVGGGGAPMSLGIEGMSLLEQCQWVIKIEEL